MLNKSLCILYCVWNGYAIQVSYGVAIIDIYDVEKA